MGVYASPGGAFVYILAPLQKTYYIRNLCPFTFKLSELYIDKQNMHIAYQLLITATILITIKEEC